MTADIGLGLSVVATALWSGLLLTLTTILHPMFAPRDAAGFVEDMRRFLPIARRSPTNYVLVIALLCSPVIALVGLRDRAGSAPFVLTALGLAAVVAGPLLMSRLLPSPLRTAPVGVSGSNVRAISAAVRLLDAEGALAFKRDYEERARELAEEGIDFAYPTQTTFTAAPDGTLVMPYAPPAKPAPR